MVFSKRVLELDLEAKASELCSALETTVFDKLRRRGVVVAISGGIDSAWWQRWPCAPWGPDGSLA